MVASAEMMFMLESFGQTSTREGKFQKDLRILKANPDLVDDYLEKYGDTLSDYDINRIYKAIGGKLW